MITHADIKDICILVDELRLRGVHIIHFEQGDLKLELHVHPLAPGALPNSEEVKERMLNDPRTTPEQRALLIAEQDARDLFSDREANDDDDE